MQKIFVEQRALKDKSRSFIKCDCMNILARYIMIYRIQNLNLDKIFILIQINGSNIYPIDLRINVHIY